MKKSLLISLALTDNCTVLLPRLPPRLILSHSPTDIVWLSLLWLCLSLTVIFFNDCTPKNSYRHFVCPKLDSRHLNANLFYVNKSPVSRQATALVLTIKTEQASKTETTFPNRNNIPGFNHILLSGHTESTWASEWVSRGIASNLTHSLQGQLLESDNNNNNNNSRLTAFVPGLPW